MTPPFQLSLLLLREIHGATLTPALYQESKAPRDRAAPGTHILKVHPSSLANLWTLATQEMSGYPRHIHHCHFSFSSGSKRNKAYHTHTYCNVYVIPYTCEHSSHVLHMLRTCMQCTAYMKHIHEVYSAHATCDPYIPHTSYVCMPCLTRQHMLHT